jgi:hypothetical protein
MPTSDERIITMLRGGLSPSVIAAILGLEVSEVRAVITGPTELPASGGGGSNVVHATNVPDQTITLVTPGQPQDVEALWRIDGPGLWAVAMWYEIKPFDDNDYAGLGILADTDLDLGQLGSSGGPDARAFVTASEILPGGWIRQHAGSGIADILMPSQWREYRVQATGWHYNALDVGDTTQPVLGDPQIRNVRVVAVRLDA